MNDSGDENHSVRLVPNTVSEEEEPPGRREKNVSSDFTHSPHFSFLDSRPAGQPVPGVVAFLSNRPFRPLRPF